jgi:hypothetical protein
MMKLMMMINVEILFVEKSSFIHFLFLFFSLIHFLNRNYFSKIIKHLHHQLNSKNKIITQIYHRRILRMNEMNIIFKSFDIFNGYSDIYWNQNYNSMFHEDFGRYLSTLINDWIGFFCLF